MTSIRVTEEAMGTGWRCHVEVEDEDGRSLHEVRVTEEDRDRYAPHHVDAARLVEESFRFLLEKEPKDAILRAFDLPVIERYFPDYPEEIKRRLGDA